MPNPKQPASASSSLLPLLLEKINSSGGRIPFVRFMDLALYHPEHGYYSSGRARLGKEGDYFTSVSVGRIYGRLLATIVREVWERLEKPSEFFLIEQGANDGQLAADILEAISSGEETFSKAIHYSIVEPFSINRIRQQERLRSFQAIQKISWVETIEDLPHFKGIHISNELLDAFPVHSLRKDGNEWVEECVGSIAGELCWTTQAITDPELRHSATQLPKDLPDGFRVEVNLGIRPWLRSIYERMERGVLLTVDYGQSGDDRYAPHRADGTLLAYQSHQRFDDPIPEPGLRDITAQVDFTALAAHAKEVGFELLGYSDQHHFLVGAAEPWLRSLGDSIHGAFSEEKQRDLKALQTLLNPGIMGRQFKAFALGKNISNTPPLGCFRHQRPGTEVFP